MNYLRAVLSGIMLWICVAVTFLILEHTPIIKDSLNIQTVTICLFIIFYSAIGATFYYKKAISISGFQVGVMMSFTAILLDALLFVPLVEIPKGSTYQDFFSNPLVWILAILNIATVYFYSKTKLKTTKKPASGL